MLTDYRSSKDLAYLATPRRHRSWLRAALLLPVLGAAAVYALVPFTGDDNGQSADISAVQATVETRLALPGQQAQDGEASTFAADSGALEVTLPELATKTLAEKPDTQQTDDLQDVTGGGFLSLADTAEADLAKLQAESNLAIQVELPLPAEGGSTAEAMSIAEAEETGKQVMSASPRPASTGDAWLEEKVRSGDSLARIFSRLGLSANLLHRIVHSSKQAKSLARIKPGQVLRVRLNDQNEFQELVLQRTAIKSLKIVAAADGFETVEVERSLEKHIAQASGTITDSLYQSAKRENLTDTLIMQLANIFGWDIDFALEIRAGDQFSLIYEDEYLDGKKYRNGTILAAEFINRGKVFRAVRYEDDQGNVGYFSPDGHSMRKTFLRAPVDFRRISSRFTKSRWHPVLGKKRSHRGVDYAASIGTPIKASGDGKVIFRGRKGGYGKTVIIQHGSQYTTLYAHLSKFRSKVKNGSRVKQGQVIGYVGKSGLATGPHLHYEFRINGVHRNPLKVKLPAAAPIAKQYRADFSTKSAPLLARLDNMSKTMVADAERHTLP